MLEGSDTCSWVIIHRPFILSNPAVTRTQYSDFFPVVLVLLT